MGFFDVTLDSRENPSYVNLFGDLGLLAGDLGLLAGDLGIEPTSSAAMPTFFHYVNLISWYFPKKWAWWLSK